MGSAAFPYLYCNEIFYNVSTLICKKDTNSLWTIWGGLWIACGQFEKGRIVHKPGEGGYIKSGFGLFVDNVDNLFKVIR
jgi:hypothetical protein